MIVRSPGVLVALLAALALPGGALAGALSATTSLQAPQSPAQSQPQPQSLPQSLLASRSASESASSASSGSAASPASASSVHLEELTWVELRDRIAGGATIAIVPVGGTEQNGPHIALGKHNARVRVLSGRIAAALGNALVAPVVAYVPEGPLDAPAGHMRFPGTLTVPEDAFEAVLVSAARSLCLHGLRDVVLLGDHGGYQANLARAAARASTEAAGRCRVHALAEYYAAQQDGFARALRGDGYRQSEVGTHAGLADTALTMAVAPTMVRAQRVVRAGREGAAAGVDGDPARASAAIGERGAALVVETSVQAIRRITGRGTGR